MIDSFDIDFQKHTVLNKKEAIKMEKYYIEIWQEHEWGVLDYFAGVRIADEKIDFFMDIDIKDEEIEEVKDNKYFKQKAIFIPRYYDGKTYKWSEKKSFQGSFIDALEYIKEVYNAG